MRTITRRYLVRLKPETIQRRFVTEMESLEDGLLRVDFSMYGISTGRTSIVRYYEKDVLSGIEWIKFHPILKNTWDLERTKSKKGFGLGTLAHVKSLICFADRGLIVPESIIVHNSSNDKRKAHLKAMRIRSGMCAEEYVERSIAYANGRGFYFKNPFN